MAPALSFHSVRLPVAGLGLALAVGVVMGCGMINKAKDCEAIVQATHDAEKMVDGAANNPGGDDDVGKQLSAIADVINKAKGQIEGIEVKDETLVKGKADLVALYGDMAKLMQGAADNGGALMKRLEEGDASAAAELEKWSTDFDAEVNKLIEREHSLIESLDKYCGAG